MKIKVNPTKPIYFNYKNHTVRCGNFITTGKELNSDDNNIIHMFIDLKEFVDTESICDKYSKLLKVSKDDIKSNIDYLLQENFLITENDYLKLTNDKKYNRENLYFYMLSNEIKTSQDLNKKSIGILGLGGIGSISMELLARSGITKFVILDCDRVDESNLIRQSTYFSQDINQFKIDSMEKYINQINSNVEIKKYNKKIEKIEDIPEDFKKVDIILCTIDKPYRVIRRIINDYCVTNNIPVIFSGFSEHVGMVGPFVIPHKTACLKCIDKRNSEEPLNNVDPVPSYGPLCTMIASIASNEIINYFNKYNLNNLEGCTFMFDMSNYKRKIIKWKKNNKCNICGGDINDNK